MNTVQKYSPEVRERAVQFQLRTIREDVTEVTLTAAAQHFCATHAVTVTSHSKL
jgi:hypothetical protein